MLLENLDPVDQEVGFRQSEQCPWVPLEDRKETRPENPGCGGVKDETVSPREGHHDVTDVFPPGGEIDEGVEFLRVRGVAEGSYGFGEIPAVFFKRLRTFPASSLVSFALESLFTKGL